MNSIKTFVENYSESDNSRIFFHWNGKHGSDFADANLDFRRRVIEVVVPMLNDVSIVLVRDLYRAETECAREAWGVSRWLTSLAKELLLRGQEEYIVDFLEGKRQSFDTIIATSQFDVPPDLVERLTGKLDRLLESTTDQKEVEILEFGKTVFSQMS